MTATTQPPKPKAKPAAAQTAAQQTTAPESSGPKTRRYRITRQLTLDLTDPMSLVSQLQAFAGGDEGNPQPVVVDVRVGTADGVNPKDAVKRFGTDNDMSGDYDAVAVSSVVTIPNVSTEVKRTVTFD